MKKRLLSILLMCCMVLTLLPVTAYAMTLTVRPVEISSGRYATVDDLETKSGAVITLGKNSRGRNGNQKWYVFGKDDGVNGRNTVLFAATSLTDPSGSEQREVFQRVLGATRIDYDSSWGSSYTDGAAAPTEVDISYYAASYSRWRLRNTIAYDNKLFNRVEKALLNETPYKNTDLGNNNRVYTLKDKLYLPAIKASEEDTIYIGSNDQIRLKSIQVQSTQADYCNAAWSRTAFDHQNVSAYSVSIDRSIYTGKKVVHNFYTDQFGTDHVVWGDTAAMLPATNLDLDKVLFASMVPLQEELSSGSGAGEVRTDFVNETNIHYPMTLRLDAEQHGKNLGELYVNWDKGEIYAKNSLGGPRQPRVWLVVQTSYVDDNTEHTSSRYWCKDISNDPSLTDEYGFVHVKLDDIRFGNGIIKLSSLDNCKIWLEASFDKAANSSASAVYTYAVEPKPLPEVTVTTITKFFDPESGEELTSASTTETSTIHAGDTFTYSYKNKPYISPDKIVNNKNKEVQQETSDYYLKRFHINNVWEDLTVELTIDHYCAAYSWDTVEETPATCTETGLTQGKTCKICGNVIEERKEIPALGHDLKTTTTATCTEPGTTTTACQREGCGYSETEDTAALGHDWGEPETVSATCTEGGLVKKTCKRDPSHVETVTSGPLGHDWEEDFTVDVQPTCETDGSKSRHCTRCDEKTDVTVVPAPGHDSSWICSLDVTVEAPKCGTVVEKRKTYSPEPPPVVTTPEGAPYWLWRSQSPSSTDTRWRTVADKIFTGTIIGGQTYRAEFSLEPKAGSPFFVPDGADIREHLTIHGGTLGSLKPHYIWSTRNCDRIDFNVLVTAVHDYDENGICRGCGVADHEHDFEEVWSADEGSHWHACGQDGCTVTKDLNAHDFGEDNATCETCGYVRTITCQHDFGTYLCDENQHWKECRKPGCSAVTACGEHVLSRSNHNGVITYYCQSCFKYRTHDHDFADEWSTSGTHHWKQCYVDNGYCNFISDYEEHDYGSETGTTCVTCGYTRTICSHTYSEGFNGWDETNHWRECTNPVCTDRPSSRKDEAVHTLNAYGDCTACGYRHTEHAYGKWHYDGSEHWKTCTKPGCKAQTGKSGHTYSGDICRICGYDSSITPAHTHYYDQWSRDSREHWRECTDPNCPEENGRIINRAAHIYDDDADTTCDLCGYVRSIAPDHSGGHVYGDWSWDVNSHWHECTDPDCPDKAGSVQDKASHVYDDDGDYDCNVCGYIRSTELSHTHTFDGWKYDAERHYHICSVKYCPYPEKMDSAPHAYDDDQDEFCNVCAYGRFGTQHAHTYGDWTADGETGHYRVCTAENCPYADKGRVTEAHSYDGDADMICDTCGYDRTVTPPAHEHTYGDWTADGETGHYRVCTDENCTSADKGRVTEAHSYDDDADMICDTCGYDRTVTPPAHAHTYGDWTADGETGHYRVCTDENCTSADKGRVTEAHSYDDDADMICDTCGYDRTVTPPAHAHTYGDWTADGETGHYRVCTDENCTSADKGRVTEAHSYDDDADMICDTCGYDRTVTPPAHAHTYGDWTADGETGHYRVCTDENCTSADKGRVTEAHSYDDDADMTCDTCGYDRTVTPPAHEHTYGDWTADGETGHYRVCTDENCTSADKGRVTEAHSYDDDADMICDTCGYDRTVTPPAHAHTYGDWIADGETGHYRVCTDENCTSADKGRVTEAHSYDDDADMTCDTCGYDRTVTPPAHAHTYGDWTADGETGHYRVCTDENCTSADKGRVTEAHSYDDDADMICDTCGYDRTVTPPAHAHTYGDWTADGETGHYRVCTDENCTSADKGRVTEAHSYDDDADMTCDTCGYDRTVTPPAPTEFIVTFDGNGGTPSAGSMTTTDQKLPSLPNASRRGSYSFDGWYTKKSGGTKITTDTVFSANTTVYAHWTYTDGGGSSGYSYYTIEATAGAGGSISPSGSISVREGRDQTFTITPDKGYAVANVKIDGKSIGAVKSYTFENVSRTHTIEVIFVKGTASARTGDSSNLPLWSALLLASTLTLAGAVHHKRKRAR